ncbi:YlbD family protein [Bacillus salitolerans]|uniref:YlbD family protein n=1 Tax=Bacillus salitolerans TaxID=1437434 RepID=A0ABW4LKG7_9BACI
MSNKTLHPSIQKFKVFVKEHPKLKDEVRKNKKTWQELFEEWYLLGEEDEVWQKYKSEGEKTQKGKGESEKTDFMSTIVSAVKNMDLAQMQHHISNVGDAISNIQQLIKQFQGSSYQSNSPSSNEAPKPFSFTKD